MTLQEFKSLVEAVIKKGRDSGLTDEEILWEIQEQVRFMAVKQSVCPQPHKAPG